MCFSASLHGLSQLVRKQAMSQYTEIEELEAVIVTQELLDLYW